MAGMDGALNGIRAQLNEESINYRMQASQLYRKEVTAFLMRARD